MTMLALILAAAGPFSVLGIPQGLNLRTLAPIAPTVVMETTSGAMSIDEPTRLTGSTIYLQGPLSAVRCRDADREPYIVARSDGVLLDCRAKARR